MQKLIGIGEIKKAARKIIRSRERTTPEGEDQTVSMSYLPLGSKKTEPPQKEEGQLSVDVYQTENEIVIVAPIAGIKAENLDLTVTDDVITIKGKRELKSQIPPENFYTRECFWGNFSRSIILPSTVDASKVQADFKDGVLTIWIPKTERVRTQIIKIKTN